MRMSRRPQSFLARFVLKWSRDRCCYRIELDLRDLLLSSHSVSRALFRSMVVCNLPVPHGGSKLPVGYKVETNWATASAKRER